VRDQPRWYSSQGGNFLMVHLLQDCFGLHTLLFHSVSGTISITKAGVAPLLCSINSRSRSSQATPGISSPAIPLPWVIHGATA